MAESENDSKTSTGPRMELSANEKRLVEAVQKNEIEEVKLLLNEKDVRVDCIDQYGTTPLQLAAFRGHIEMCQLLLAHGADVNSNDHEHGYTALMFAALSGKSDLCRIFMEAGAKTYRTNKVGRTASEMAAFTGQHHCVSVINNFMGLDDIEYYTKPQGTEKEPRLDPRFTASLHKLTLTYNIHPVKTILFLCDNIELTEHEKPLLFSFEDMMERQMRRKETNEVMAFKLHIIYSTLKACFKHLHDAKKDKSKTAKDQLILFAKSLLATKEENFPRMLELFLRNAIREFPYHHSVLFQTMVRTLSKTELGSEPSAATVVNQALVGQRMFADETFCTTCGGSPAKKRCGSCKMVNYCSVECQKLHWFTHKRWCPYLAKEHEQFLIEKKKMDERDREQERAAAAAEQQEAENSGPIQPTADEPIESAKMIESAKADLEAIPGTT